MNKLPHKNLQGFTLVELLLVIVIMAIIMISILPLSLKYKEKTDLEATQINVESLIEFSRKQSTLNYERHQHGFTISKTENKIYYISRESESSIPVTHKNIKLPSNIQITSPSNDQTVWFEKKTGFVTTDSYINKIVLESSKFTSTINITTSGIFSSSPITPK